VERERACDDVALKLGTPSPVYASHLLEIARSQVERLSAVNALAMARRSSLAERTQSIMDRKQRRGLLGSESVALAVALALLCALPLATLDVFGRQQLEREPAQDPTTQQRVPDTRELIDQLSNDSDPQVRRMAAWWLGEHEAGRAVQPLHQSLHDPSPEVRQAAAWALGEIKDRSSIEPLIALLDDQDRLVREMAVLSLGEIEHESAIAALSDVADREAELRGAVIWALGEIGRDARQAREDVFKAMGQHAHPNQEVWAGDTKLDDLSWLDREVADLVKALHSGDPATRREAALAIGVLGRHDRLRTLEPVAPLLDLLRDPVAEVRAVAIWSLDEINPSRWQGHHHRHDH
jgi:HEAT repeat protein